MSGLPVTVEECDGADFGTGVLGLRDVMAQIKKNVMAQLKLLPIEKTFTFMSALIGSSADTNVKVFSIGRSLSWDHPRRMSPLLATACLRIRHSQTIPAAVLAAAPRSFHISSSTERSVPDVLENRPLPSKTDPNPQTPKSKTRDGSQNRISVTLSVLIRTQNRNIDESTRRDRRLDKKQKNI